MKQTFRLSVITSIFICGAFATVSAQTLDPFVSQITSSTRDSFVNDISGNGRFVVIESNGDIGTKDSSISLNPDNSDGNREIFLFDYAQRRVFQITNTRSRRRDASRPAINPANLTDFSNIEVEVSNNRPVISNDGRYIVFGSNAATPGGFDGDAEANRAALRDDGNQEIFLYLIPDNPPNPNLSSGAEQAFVNLSGGLFTRITNTPASRLPQPGTANSAPLVADDNRSPATNDDASIIAFGSTRDIATDRTPGQSGRNNEDANPEIFIFNRNTNSIIQLTNTRGTLVFTDNPSLSGDGSVLAFIANANIPDTGSTTGSNTDGNAEIYVARFNGAIATSIRQATRTTAPTPGDSINLLSPGRRLSRNGNFLAFESAAELAGGGAIQSSYTVFIYNVTNNTFTQAGPRATSGIEVRRFPTFTDDGSTLIFASALNFNADGSAPTASGSGLNPNGRAQVFSTPVATPNAFTRLTDTPASTAIFATLQPFASNTARRLAFSIARTELGGGNSDNSSEAFYLLSPAGAIATSATVTYFTGASLREVATPGASPAPTPAPLNGFAPGMLAIVRSATALAPSEQRTADNSASPRRVPSLPVELNGVSVSVGGAAAGLYFVSPGQINFMVPQGLAPTTGTNTLPFVISNNGTIIRSTVQLVAVQPDVFSSTNGPGGRASVMNVTSGMMMTPEPFTVTTTIISQGQPQTVPTVLGIMLTGVRGVTRNQVTVRIGTTDITGEASILAVEQLDAPGFFQINVQLPPTLAAAGDVPVIVTVTSGGQTSTSRPAETAPRITIN